MKLRSPLQTRVCPSSPLGRAPARPQRAPTLPPVMGMLERAPTAIPRDEVWIGNAHSSAGVGVVSSVGLENGVEKQCNQDVWLVEHVTPAPLLAVTTLGVFDGHGPWGEFAARTVARQVAGALHGAARRALVSPAERSWWDYDYVPLGAGAGNLGSSSALEVPLADFTFDSAQACLGEAFGRAAEAVAEERVRGLLLRSGTTACVAMVLPESVVAAWVGDSRAVVGTCEGNRYEATQLTRDHKPEKLSELSRVLRAGGRVCRPAKDGSGNPIGPFRIRLPVGPSPAITVARAFGDHMLAPAGIVPTPDFAVYSRSESAAAPAPGASAAPAELLLVASDGLWEMVSNQEAVDIVADAGSPERGAAELVDAAKRRWRRRFGSLHCDDITVAVAFL